MLLEAFYDLPPSFRSNPYQASLGGAVFAASGRHIVAGNNFEYPLTLFSPQGDSLGWIGAPPPSFRPLPTMEPGQFAGAAQGAQLTEFFKSFTVIAALHLDDERNKVVTHGEMARDLTTRIRRG